MTKVAGRILCLAGIVTVVAACSVAAPTLGGRLAQSDGLPQGPVAALGLAYGPYRDGQNPDFKRFPTVEEMRADLVQLRPITRNLRTYGSAGALRALAGEATALGFSVLAGAWLVPTKERQAHNEAEVAAVIELANSGHAQTIIVGNETLLRGDLRIGDLLDYIARVRASVPANVQVTTAEPWSIWVRYPKLREAVDVLLVHIYPFWEGKSIDEATPYVREKYAQVEALAGGRPVIVGETGWPSAGTPEQAGVSAHVVPGEHQQRRYLKELTQLARDRRITFYWFAAYDEEWKWSERVQSGGVTRGERLPMDRNFSGRFPGASWGILTADGRLKPHLADLFPSLVASESRRTRVIFDHRGLAGLYDMGIDSSGREHQWLSQTDDGMRMAYPSGQTWGAVFITVGRLVDPPRPWKDFSAFSALSVELRGERGGESLEIGIKDHTDPDNGRETKVRIPSLSRSWTTYSFPLRAFKTADLRRLYVPIEFVFSGRTAQAVYFRDVRYHP